MTLTDPYPCTHGYPNAAACIDCMNEGPVAPPQLQPGPAVVEKWIVARFNSTCPQCQGPIIADTEKVGFTEVYGWVCQDCGRGRQR